MATKTAEEINTAILDCANRCLAAEDPVDCAHTFAAQLDASGKWEKADIETVVDGALEVVAKLTGKREIMPNKRRMES